VPSEFAVPGGLTADALRALLEAVAGAADEVVGLEVTAFGVPAGRRAADVALLAGAVAPLLP
jgi:arginase family enzyme